MTAGKWGRTLGTGLVLGLASAMLHPAFAAGGGACSKPIEVSAGWWEPYNYFDEEGSYIGIDVDLSRAIFREAGCVLVERGPMPAARNTYLFERGKIDLMLGASRTPERETGALFSVAYRDETVALFALEASYAQFRHVRSFVDVLQQPQAILAPTVGWYGPDFASHVLQLRKEGRLSLFTNFRQGINMLVAGRAGFILGDAASIEHAAAAREVRVRALPFKLLQAPVHMMFNRQTVSAGDVRLIDAAIGRLQKRGELARIIAPYSKISP